MLKREALEILHLSEDATPEQIRENYRQLRWLYFPPRYGWGHEFTKEQITEEIYKELSGDYYKEPKGVQYLHFVEDRYHYAIARYADICMAYDYLTDPKNQNEYNVDPNTPEGYDTLHYGPRIAKIRESISIFTMTWMIKTLIAAAICGFIGAMFNDPNHWLLVIANVLQGFYVLQLIAACVVMPLDMLLLIPKRIWNGMKKGAKMGIWLTKPITIAFFGAAFGVGGVLSVFLFPLAYSDRVERYRPCIKRRKKGIAAAEKIYDKMMKNIDELFKQDGQGMVLPVSVSTPCIHKEVKRLTKEYYDLRRELEYAKQDAADAVKYAGKMLDIDSKFAGWCDDIHSQTERELDSMRYDEALTRQYVLNTCASKRMERADALLSWVYKITDADPDEYLDKE